VKTRLSLALLGIFAMSGCGEARFYPVQGPLATQPSVPVFVAKVSGAFHSGTFSMFLDDGEMCRGRWALVPPVQAPSAATGTEGNVLGPVWDAVYGTGFYANRVLGAKLHARAVGSGDQGTVLVVEVYQSGGAMSGVAKDSRGNVFKLVF
jgi:hypothetical protein